MIKLNFKGELSELKEGISHIQTVLAFEQADDGVLLEVKKSDELYARFDGEKGEISYITKASFFRIFALFLKNYTKKSNFEINEEIKIDFLNVMLDVSRNGVMRIESLKEYVKYIALMGLNGLSLYMEDVFEVKERPYFGYMRGRYTYEELKELDDFAYSLGVEVFPAIEALGHMEQYLKYHESRDVRDTDTVLLAESEKTYEFLELLIKTATKPFRSKKIHLALDETHTLGLGEYLRKNGYKDKTDIFLSHLNRICKITKKLGLEQDSAGDMFFRLASKTGDYYDKTIKFSREVKDLIPENVALGLWYYRGVNPDGLVESLMENQMDLSKNATYTGGVWSFKGHLCDQKYSLRNVEICMPLAKKYGFKRVGCSMYGDNGTECDYFYTLLPLQAYGEHMYNDEVLAENIKENFEFITGFNYDALIRMSDYHNDFEREKNGELLSDRYYGKCFFWQDILMGVVDDYLDKQPMSEHYKKLSEDLKKYVKKGDKWEMYYDFSYKICDMLSLKCEIAENLRKAYFKNDREYLKMLTTKKLPLLSEKVSVLQKIQRKMWHKTNKPFGFEVLDVRYGGLISRIDTAILRIEEYLNGEITKIEELEEKRLPYATSGVHKYERIYTSSSIR